MRKWSGALVLAALALLARVEGQQREKDQSRGHHDDFVQGELLVQFSRGLSPAQREGMLSARRFGRVRRFDALDSELVRVPPGLAVAVAAGGLRSVTGILNAQPNYLRYAVQSAPPNDRYWLEGRLWGLERIQAPQVWNTFSRGDDRVVVASIDTGINYRHPDLAPNMWRNPLEIAGNGIDDDGNGYVDDVFGIDARNHDGDPMDDHGHGTMTAGTIAAAGNNGEGLVGVSWNAKLLACKFMGADGVGTDAGAIECFNYIVGLRNRGVNIRVSSNGWGAVQNDSGQAGVLKAAIDSAGAAGILNVFGAGNGGDNNDREPFEPASFGLSSSVSVASSDRGDGRSTFSNYGGSSVDLAAPGEDILTTYQSEYASASGTSMAAAHVAGVAALLAGLDPTLSADGMKVILLRTVDQLPQWTGRVVSGGRLNAFRAASAVGVAANGAPIVSITSPANGDVLTTPVNTTIEAAASDASGSLKQVAFYANGTLIGTATAAPFSTAWNPTTVGDYMLTAVATDNLDATATSAGVSVKVVAPNVPPVVSLTGPAEGASFVAPATIPLSATATDADGSVASVTFYANGAPIGVDSTSPFAMSWTPVAAGDYTLTATATDNKGATTTSAGVSVTVAKPNVPPAVSLTSPAAGVPFVAPATIPVSATATDADGSVASVTFYANGAPIGVDSASPFEMSWAPVAAGDYTLTAVAMDNKGATTTSASVSVTVAKPNVPPAVSLTSPAADASFVAPATISLSAKATDADGSVASVTFYANGAPIGVGSASPFELSWTPVAAGDYTLTAMATDNQGATTTSAGVSITVAKPNVPPAVSLTSPAAGAPFVAPATISVSATATDTDGSVSSVTFYANGAPIGVDSASPFAMSWTPVAAGDYTLTAVAMDNKGATTTSAGVSVTVAKPNVLPVVSLTSPGSGATFVAPATVPLSANATDEDGTVSFVTFYANGAPVGVASASPFAMSWSPVGAGGYTLTAVATDNKNATTTSTSVSIVVVPPNVPPTVTLTAPTTGSSFVAPVSLTLMASAADADGAVTLVSFFVDGISIGSDSSSPFTLLWSNVQPGTYTLTASAIDNAGAVSLSTPVVVTITAPPRINQALAANGGVASASSTLSAAYPPSGANNGDRRGLNWGAGGGWNDGTLNAGPDWLAIAFNGPKTIDEVSVFSMQDSFNTPVEPTATMTFTLWGLRGFEIQYWDGANWLPIPGASVTTNNLVWRRFTFTPVTTTAIRVFVTAALNGSSRVMEVEAWGTDAFGPAPEATSPTPMAWQPEPAWPGGRRED